MDEKKTLTQSAIMEMGFTKTMIVKLLPEPLITKPNPYGRNPIKLLYEKDILALMETDAYKLLH